MIIMLSIVFAVIASCQIPQQRQQIDSGVSQAELDALRASNAALQQQVQDLLKQMRNNPDDDTESDKEAQVAEAVARYLQNNPSQLQQFARDTLAARSVMNDPYASQWQRQQAKKSWYENPIIQKAIGGAVDIGLKWGENKWLGDDGQPTDR